ncbi:hypothetical protein F480_02825 [Bibersteinia trehalosi Y31]|uniref:DUF4298 domain-containing protein n=1 Tax=Bibersteinia trehalosi Y31 TaxID=1261658 RepID=A0A179D072_BIBTR|nr:DUF4298 domain-containing protein [Bibersteinia trehalosi]OAQ15482.1 hypothetical protein F480_02825 [Bibersteinia trehalosi Y31]
MKKEEIQKLQDLYNQWVKLVPELEKSIAQWQQAERLLKPLSAFYASPVWRELHEHFDEILDTQGNYSILSEDALWNALSDHKALYDELDEILQTSFSKYPE